MHRPYRIAMLARRYQMMCERPRLAARTAAQRADEATSAEPMPLGTMDMIQVAGASDLDVVCAQAARVLATPGSKRALLEVLLSALDSDHIVAIHYAIPEDRRRGALADKYWAYHVAQAEGEMPAALEWVRDAVELLGHRSSRARPTG